MTRQLPKTPQKFLEEIISNAELFYVRSLDYFELANTFKVELSDLGIYRSHAK